MSSNITMDVLMLEDHYNHIPGAPDANAGEIVTVPFNIGAILVAAEYAEATESEVPEQEVPEQEVFEEDK